MEPETILEEYSQIMNDNHVLCNGIILNKRQIILGNGPHRVKHSSTQAKQLNVEFVLQSGLVCGLQYLPCQRRS